MADSDAQQRIAFPRLDDEEIAALAELGARRHLRDGDSPFRAGERRPGFHVVLPGAVEILGR